MHQWNYDFLNHKTIKSRGGYFFYKNKLQGGTRNYKDCQIVWIYEIIKIVKKFEYIISYPKYL